MAPSRSTKDKKSSEKRILANRYQVEKKLGSGNFGTAFLVKDLRRKDELKVLKEIAVGELQPDETVDAKHEAQLLAKLDNPGIVKFHDSFLDGEYFCIITEYCEGGDLDQKISAFKKQGKRFTESQIIEWTVQLLLAVQHMHSRRVLHRDLKTRNIFLKNNRVKIGDFGISRILMGTVDMASTFTGTPYYMSPEVLKHEGYNSKSDVWSVGCILYELGALEHAFEGQSLMGVMYKIVEGDAPALPGQYSKDLNAFLKSILVKDPDLRPSAGDALKTPFIAKHLEKIHDSLVDKRNQKPDNTIIANSEARELAQELKKKWRVGDLRAEEEETKYKNLLPREKMRLRKMQAADKKGQVYREAAAENFVANLTRQKTNIERKFKTHQTLSSKPSVDESQKAAYRPTKSANFPARQEREAPPSPPSDYDLWSDEDEGTILQPISAQRTRSRDYYSPSPEVIDEIETDDQSSTLRVSRDSGVVSRDVSLNDVTLKAAGTVYEDRPIAPMKNTMVYDKHHSSLDFEDGIPAEPALAETFYSQYEDFEEAGGAEGRIRSGEEEEEGDEVLESDDEQDLIYNMEHVLAQTDGAMQTQTINDDKTNAVFGAAAKEEKVKNMREKCRRQMGDEVFNKVYRHIYDFRLQNRLKNVDDSAMMRALNNIVTNQVDAFLVDQLVFIEMES